MDDRLGGAKHDIPPLQWRRRVRFVKNVSIDAHRGTFSNMAPKVTNTAALLDPEAKHPLLDGTSGPIPSNTAR